MHDLTNTLVDTVEGEGRVRLCPVSARNLEEQGHVPVPSSPVPSSTLLDRPGRDEAEASEVEVLVCLVLLV